MPPILVPFVLMWALLRELYDLSKYPHYRALLYWMLLLLVVGTVFYNRVEGWSILDSFYFTVVTLATVGYGDFAPTTPEAKLFTTVYIFLGVSLFVSFVSLLANERRKIYLGRTRQADQPAATDTGANDSVAASSEGG